MQISNGIPGIDAVIARTRSVTGRPVAPPLLAVDARQSRVNTKRRLVAEAGRIRNSRFGVFNGDETVQNPGGLPAISPGGRPGGAQGKRNDQDRDDLPALFSPQGLDDLGPIFGTSLAGHDHPRHMVHGLRFIP
jgi:hypothetical protein